MKLFGSEDRLRVARILYDHVKAFPFFSLEASFGFESYSFHRHFLLLIILMALGRLKLLSAAMDR